MTKQAINVLVSSAHEPRPATVVYQENVTKVIQHGAWALHLAELAKSDVTTVTVNLTDLSNRDVYDITSVAPFAIGTDKKTVIVTPSKYYTKAMMRDCEWTASIFFEGVPEWLHPTFHLASDDTDFTRHGSNSYIVAHPVLSQRLFERIPADDVGLVIVHNMPNYRKNPYIGDILRRYRNAKRLVLTTPTDRRPEPSS